MTDSGRSRFIAISAFILAMAIFAITLAPESLAVTRVAHNSTSPKLNAESCFTEEGGTTCGLTCQATCSGQGDNRVEIAISQCLAGVPLGSREVIGDLSTNIIIESDMVPPGSWIPVQVHYDIWWKGNWCMTAVFEDYRTMRKSIWLDVLDASSGARIYREPIDEYNPSSLVAVGVGKFDVVVGAGKGRGFENQLLYRSSADWQRVLSPAAREGSNRSLRGQLVLGARLQERA